MNEKGCTGRKGREGGGEGAGVQWGRNGSRHLTPGKRSRLADHIAKNLRGGRGEEKGGRVGGDMGGQKSAQRENR